MRIQVVHNKNDLFGLWIVIVQKILDSERPVNLGSALSDLNVPLAFERFKKHEQITDAIAFILIIITSRFAWFSRQWFPSLTRQLFARLIHADQRIFRIKRPFVYCKDILHGTDKGGTCFRRNTPLTFQPRLKFVFFKVCLTASYEILSTYPSSTTLSANNRKVQRALPFGGSLQQRATRWASTSPSIFLRDTFWRYWRLERTASKPSSTSCFRTFSIVCTVTSKASLIFSSGQAGPSSLSSAFSKIRTRVNILPEPRPEVNNFFKVLRSSWVSRTIYFFIVSLKVWVTEKVTTLREYTIYNGKLQAITQ